MARITDIIASVTNALAGIKPGDQVPLTAICNPDGSPISAGGGGGSGGTQAAPFYDVIVSDAAGTQPIGAPTDAATASGSSTSVIGALRAIRDKLLGTVAVSNAALTSLDGKTPALTRATIVEGSASTGTASTAATANNTPTNANALTIMPASATVRRRRVQNLGTQTVYVRFNNFADATPAFIPAASGAGSTQTKACVALAAGATWETPVDEDATGLVSVCSATANQTVSFSAS